MDKFINNFVEGVIARRDAAEIVLNSFAYGS